MSSTSPSRSRPTGKSQLPQVPLKRRNPPPGWNQTPRAGGVCPSTFEPLRITSYSMFGIICASLGVTGQHIRELADAGAKGALPPEKAEATYDKP